MTTAEIDLIFVVVAYKGRSRLEGGGFNLSFFVFCRLFVPFVCLLALGKAGEGFSRSCCGVLKSCHVLKTSGLIPPSYTPIWTLFFEPRFLELQVFDFDDVYHDRKPTS